MGSPIIIHEINPCSFYWYFKILLSLGQPVSLSCEVIGWTENTPHCLCPLENSYSTWHITASCSCNRTGLRPCLRNIRKRYRHQSPHKTTLLLTSCLFSFPITWQMRLIWSVNVIQRLLVKQVVLSSWCIVQASVSNNILLSMFNSRHHSVYRALVLFPVLTWIQHKHGEQQRTTKNNITVLTALIKLKAAFCISSRKITKGLKLKLPGATSQVVLSMGASWTVATNTNVFTTQNFIYIQIFAQLYRTTGWMMSTRGINQNCAHTLFKYSFGHKYIVQSWNSRWRRLTGC